MKASALLARVLAATGLVPGAVTPPIAQTEAGLALVLEFAYTVHSQPPRRDRRTGDWPRERSRMYIYGTSQIHAAQPMNAPHRMAPTQNTSRGYSAGVDQLDISPEADFVAQARELPEIREERVAALKAQIQSGVYETADKLDMALSRLLDEIA
jgi:negative regulator of flagellin synthesis FlgM